MKALIDAKYLLALSICFASTGALSGLAPQSSPATLAQPATSLAEAIQTRFPMLAPQLDARAQVEQQTADVLGQSFQAFAPVWEAGPPAQAASRATLSGSRLQPLLPLEHGEPMIVSLREQSVALQPLGAAASRGRASDGKVSYFDAYPGTDLLYTLRPWRIEEFLLLRHEAAPRSFSYEVASMQGVEALVLEHGTIRFVATSGPSLRIERPWLIDADGVRSHTAAYWELGGSEAQPVVTLQIDAQGLKFPLLVDPTWSATDSLSSPRQHHAQIRLMDGRVLAAAGFDFPENVDSAEIWDPATESWELTGSLRDARREFGAVLLPDGKVLVAGGYGDAGPLASAEIYNPVTGTWTLTDSLSEARSAHSMTLLADGRVLVAGGNDGTATLASCEIWSPATGTWSTTGLLTDAREKQTEGRLLSGQVLVAGGMRGGVAIKTTETFNPSSGTWTRRADLTVERRGHAMVILADGKAFVAGGYSTRDYLNSTEIYDPTAATWTPDDTLSTPRLNPSMVILSDGRLLITGGQNPTEGRLTSTEIYNFGSRSWTPDASLNQFRELHKSTLLLDERVLVAGGTSAGADSLSFCELWWPDAEISLGSCAIVDEECDSLGGGDGNIDPGDTLSYTLTFRNDSITPVPDFQATVSVVSGGTLVSGAIVGPRMLPAGGSFDHPIVVDVTGACGELLDIDVLGLRSGGGSVSYGDNLTGCDYDIAPEFDSCIIRTPPRAPCPECSPCGVAVVAFKYHNDPHGDGILLRGDTLRYTVLMRNLAYRTITGIRLLDPMPAGVRFGRYVDPGGGTPAGTPVDVRGLDVTATDSMGTGSTESVVFEVVEDGTLGAGALICNEASIITSASPGPFVTPPSCISLEMVSSCLVSGLTPRTNLLGVKTATGSGARFEWSADPLATEYHLNSVTAKTDLVPPGPSLSGGADLQCSAPLPTCTDTDAIATSGILFYEALSACGPGATEEGPVD